MGTYRFAAVLTSVVFGMFDLILTLLFFVLLVSGIENDIRDKFKWIGIASNVVFVVILIAVFVVRAFRVFG